VKQDVTYAEHSSNMPKTLHFYLKKMQLTHTC